MSSYTRIATVTGGNKGVGLAIVRQLALQYPQSVFAANKNNNNDDDGSGAPFLIYLTARDRNRGEEAVKTLQADPQLRAAKSLRSHGGLTEIKFSPLDIDSTASIEAFADHLKSEHPEGIDCVINNAGIAMNGFDLNVVKTTLHCNYYGTLKVIRRLLPLVRDGGRVVNVSSINGQLSASKYSPAIRQRFLHAQSEGDVTALMEDFTAAVADNSYHGQWPGAAYGVSKAGIIGLTRVIAREVAATGSTTLVNACCPGYVRTDMTRGGGSKTPDQGAMTPVLLALGDIGGSNGEFWQDEKKLTWG